jgi:hypothetical protein
MNRKTEPFGTKQKILIFTFWWSYFSKLEMFELMNRWMNYFPTNMRNIVLKFTMMFKSALSYCIWLLCGNPELSRKPFGKHCCTIIYRKLEHLIRSSSSLVYSSLYVSRYESNAYYVLLKIIITIIMKFPYIMGTFFTTFRSSFQKVSFTTNALFPPLQEILYAGCLNLLTETSERLKLTLFRFGDVHKTESSDCTLQGSKNIEVGGC